MAEKRQYKYDFYPKRMASWWNDVDVLLWPDVTVKEKIRKRAKAFHDAGVDSVMNYGLHMRFDFSDYFQNLHGYMKDVCDELHKYGIKFVDHYTCNLIERPRGLDEFYKLHRSHRHHILLHKDFDAAPYAQYDGHRFWDLCEVDFRDGSRGYTNNYQAELFCHNNPEFLEMHKNYLKRLIREVPIDAIEVDDMCEYAGLAVCGCKYCRARFKRDYGMDIPDLSDKDFWGDTSGHPYTWGNYKNPAFRAFLKMRVESIRDHIAMVKEAVGDIPLFTCCSATGPMVLNALSLDLEASSDILDMVMLENCGLTTASANWIAKDAEAMQQRDIAAKMGKAPAVALSYTTFPDSAYLGWALARFWSAANWSSTMNGRLDVEPEEKPCEEKLVAPVYKWELENSQIDPHASEYVINARLVNNRYNRINGWKSEKGVECWGLVTKWAEAMVRSSVQYRFVRFEELADAKALLSEDTSIVMESNACVSDAQFDAIKEYLEKGGKLIMTLPFGDYDENGFERSVKLSDLIAKGKYAGLKIVSGASDLPALIESGDIVPNVKIIKGDPRRSFRLAKEDGRLVIHIMNTALTGVPHKWLTTFGNRVLDRLETDVKDHCYEIEITGKDLPELREKKAKSYEFSGSRGVKVEKTENGYKMKFDLSGSLIYAVIE